jgi:cell division protein FtsZ
VSPAGPGNPAGAGGGEPAGTSGPASWRPFELDGSPAGGPEGGSPPERPEERARPGGEWIGLTGGPDDTAAGDRTKIDSVPAPRPANGNGRSDAGGTRRKSVVFEEDDELDVPDFLK